MQKVSKQVLNEAAVDITNSWISELLIQSAVNPLFLSFFIHTLFSFLIRPACLQIKGKKKELMNT